MNLRSNARWFDDVPDEMFFRQVWDIDDSELSKVGDASNDHIYTDGSALLKLGVSAAKQGAAILEFQDLQDLPIPSRGEFLNVNYFFFEGLNSLREAIVAGMNGQVHASLAVLRSTLELMLVHAWWKQQRQIADSFEEFYDWLRGQKSAPPAGKLIRSLYPPSGLPTSSPTAEDVRELYSQLCSYAHKPILTEAVTVIRGGNTAEPSSQLLKWWLEVLTETQRIILDTLVRSSPSCLFPVNIVRKFGFGPPVGIFFDSSNCFALEGALGGEVFRVYQTAYAAADPPASQLEWARVRPDLSDGEIRES